MPITWAFRPESVAIVQPLLVNFDEYISDESPTVFVLNFAAKPLPLPL